MTTPDTQTHLGELVAALKAATSSTSALRAIRPYREVLFRIRESVEAYLSKRPEVRDPLDPLFLVNILALFYFRTRRPFLARDVLNMAASIPTANVPLLSQTLLNLVRLDRITESAEFAHSAGRLATHLLAHESLLKCTAPVGDVDGCDSTYSLFDVQAICLAREIVRSYPRYAENLSGSDPVRQIWSRSPVLAKSDLGMVGEQLRSTPPKTAFPIVLIGIDRVPPSEYNLLSATDLNALRGHIVDLAIGQVS